MKIMIIWGVIVTAVFVLFPRQISSLFFYEPEVLEIAVGYMIIIGLGEAFLCVEMLTIGALSGLGKTKNLQYHQHPAYRFPHSPGACPYRYLTWSDRYLVGSDSDLYRQGNCI